MSIAFTGNDYVLVPSLAAGDFTVTCWYKPTLLDTNWRNIFYATDASAGVEIAAQTVNTTLYAYGTSGSTLTVDTWYHFGIRFTAGSYGGADDVTEIFLNGVSDIYEARERGINALEAWDVVEFGRWYLSADWGRGNLSGVKIWERALTDAEIRSEMYSITPRNSTSLLHWFPCFPGATERYRNYTGGSSLTAGGTPSDGGASPVSWGAPVLVMGAVVTAAPPTLLPRLSLLGVG